MMRKILLSAAVIILCLSSLTAWAGPVEIDGMWVSDYMTVEINVDKGIYRGVNMGKPFSKKIKLLEHYANVFVLSAADGKITIQMGQDGGILLTGTDGRPSFLERFKD